MDLIFHYPNGLPAQKLTPEERQRVLDLLRVMNSKFNCESHISDFFFRLQDWPGYIKDIIYCRRMSYYERMLVVCFFYGNGCTLPVMLVFLFRLCGYPFDLIKVIDIYRYLENVNNPARNQYYYYDIMLRGSYYFSGQRRISRPFRGDRGASAVFTDNGSHFTRCREI
jgi:hypothetical protein